MAAKTTVLVVGAGPSGLAAAKSALEYGLEPVVLEAGAGVGGLWRGDGGSGAWDGMHTNLSRHSCAFSDFPWRRGDGDPPLELFPSRARMLGYLERYAAAFGVLPLVRLGCRVRSLRPLGGGRWAARWTDAAGAERSREFDRVIVCSGFFTRPRMPARLPGQDAFEAAGGRVVHSSSAPSPGELARGAGRVAVVGGAFSGSDVAALLAGAGARVDLLVRRPIWTLPRLVRPPGAARALPLDLVFYTRAGRRRAEAAPAPARPEDAWRAKNAFLGSVAERDGMPHAPPDGHDAPPHVAISDLLPPAVREGAVAVHCGAEAARFEGADTLVLDDGTALRGVRTVVACTGFATELPFLDEAARRACGHVPEDRLQPLLLHDAMWPGGLPGLAFVGMYRGPYFAVIELQARAACRAFAAGLARGGGDDDAVRRGLEAERGIRDARPRPQFPHADYVGLADALAARIGVSPRPGDLEEDDAALAAAVRDGPVVPAHYRVSGEHSNRAAAAEAILAAAREVA